VEEQPPRWCHRLDLLGERAHVQGGQSFSQQ
jgi:hypothetical protein